MEVEEKVEEAQEETQDDGLYYPPGYQRNAEPVEQRNAEPTEDPTVTIKKGWEEDRERLDRLEEENKDLKIRLSARDGEEDMSQLTEDERVEKLLAKRELEKKQSQEHAEEKEKRELKYLRVTDKFFVENEKDILRLKKEEGLTLSQSVKIFKKQQELIAKTLNKPVEKATVKVIKKPTTGNFGDMYREGL
jgi:hypothetical protein